MKISNNLIACIAFLGLVSLVNICHADDVRDVLIERKAATINFVSSHDLSIFQNRDELKCYLSDFSRIAGYEIGRQGGNWSDLEDEVAAKYLFPETVRLPAIACEQALREFCNGTISKEECLSCLIKVEIK